MRDGEALFNVCVACVRCVVTFGCMCGSVGASPTEVTYFTNLYVFILMTILGGGTGHIPAVIGFASSNFSGAVQMFIYTVVAYVAISCHMRVVQKYGSVVAVLVGNMRKAGACVFVRLFVFISAPVIARLCVRGCVRAFCTV